MSEVWPEPEIRIEKQEVWPTRYRAACGCGWTGAVRWNTDDATEDADLHAKQLGHL